MEENPTEDATLVRTMSNRMRRQSLGRHSTRSRKESLTGDKFGGISSNSLRSQTNNAPEINEIVSSKIMATRLTWMTLLFNILLLIFFNTIRKELSIHIPLVVIKTFGTLAIEILLLLANILTIKVADDALAVYFGSRITSKKGYSLAICGFSHALPYQKLQFCNELSLSSSCRKPLSRISYIWVVLETLKLITPFSAIALHKNIGNTVQGVVSCVEYTQEGDPIDRNWPTYNSSSGFAELIFGTALGNLRSEMDVNVTTMFMTPQMVGALSDGSTLDGPGFVTDILSSCKCKPANTDEWRKINPKLPLVDAQSMLANLQNTRKLGLYSHLDMDGEDVVLVSSAISGTSLCGGSNQTFVPFCLTKFHNHRKAILTSAYMTDGTPASVAQKRVDIQSIIGKGNSTWVFHSLKNILEGELSGIELPSTIPALLNPLFYWTTPNLLAIDPALMDAGLETLFAILLRGGMQRTLSVIGNSCLKRVEVNSITLLSMHSYGVEVANIILSLHLTVCVFSLLAYIPWFLSEDCIGPGIRIIQNQPYFSTLVSCSRLAMGTDEMCNAPAYQIWQRMDVVMRVGESIDTVDDEMGHLILDKPKMVSGIKNGKRYC